MSEYGNALLSRGVVLLYLKNTIVLAEDQRQEKPHNDSGCFSRHCAGVDRWGDATCPVVAAPIAHKKGVTRHFLFTFCIIFSIFL
jgi:hypothetical protein